MLLSAFTRITGRNPDHALGKLLSATQYDIVSNMVIAEEFMAITTEWRVAFENTRLRLRVTTT